MYCNFYYFFLSIFQLRIPSKCTDKGFFLGVTPNIVVYLSFQNYARMFVIYYGFVCGLDMVLRIICVIFSAFTLYFLFFIFFFLLLLEWNTINKERVYCVHNCSF